MVAGSVLFVASFGVAMGVLIWRISTLNTDPTGFTTIAWFAVEREAEHAREILEEAGIRAHLEDYRQPLRCRMPNAPFALPVTPRRHGNRAEAPYPEIGVRSSLTTACS